MTRGRLLARAVAYTAAPAHRHHDGLTQVELETFWSFVDQLRRGVRASVLERGVQVPPRHIESPRGPSRSALSPMQADRLRREFWADQAATPRRLP